MSVAVQTLCRTYSTEQSPSCKANRFSVSQEIPRILCSLKVHYRSHMCLLPIPILSQLEPVHNTTSHFLKIHLTIILPPKPCIRLSSISATCPAHLILLDFITRKILGEEYRSLSSSLCSFLHSCHLVRLRLKYATPYSQPSLQCDFRSPKGGKWI